jgi:dCTP deaminase
MVRGDRWWRHYGPQIVTEFQPGQVRDEHRPDYRQGISRPFSVEVKRVISYGTSSAGYDLKLSASGLQLFTAVHGVVNDAVIDPKRFDERCLITLEAEYDYRDSPDTYYTLPAHSYALGVTLETITMPKDHLGLVVGKSTYARCGLIVNTTPLEPGWTGQLVLELFNATPLPLRVYAREGIAQLLMIPIDMTPEVTYADRQGKYQGQMGITTARV